MSIPAKYLASLEAGNYYHVYNRTNNRELLFRSNDNYTSFLRLYDKYLGPFCNTYSWSLLPNHFHFLVQAKPMDVMIAHILAATDQSKLALDIIRKDITSTHKLVSNAFKRLFTAYAMGFNRSWLRRGNLFHRPFKRLLVEDEQQLINTSIYIHTNPRHHKLATPFELYPWSSYNLILEQAHGLESAFLLSLFGGTKGYVSAHRSRADDIPPSAIE